jgi:hypothetical protein
MFNSLIIENFRGFKKLEVGPLDSVNLIAAKNNGGKTSLLEAIWLLLHPEDPLQITRLNGERNIATVQVGYAAMWEWLFYNREYKGTDCMISGQTESVWNRLRLNLNRSDKMQFSAGMMDKRELEKARAEALALVLRVSFEVDGEVKQRVIVEPKDTEGNLTWMLHEKELPRSPDSVYIGARSQPNSVEMFSSLVKNKAEGPVIEAARRVDGRLQKLSVLALGAQPMIHADLGGKELVPLRLMGDGFSRLIEILIVIFAARGGVVLIDEIENGLHYSALPELWGAIYEASQAAGVQIFATTHSYECIKVAHEVFREHDPYRLRLHRLDFDVDKGTVVTTFDKDTLETTLEHLWEIR